MTTSYVKEKATNKVLTSTNGQDQNNPIHVEAVNNFVISRGWSLDDYEVGFADDNVVKEWFDIQDEALKTYADKRKEEYDQLNQFELIGEDSINGTTKHKDAILAIKAKHPKE